MYAEGRLVVGGRPGAGRDGTDDDADDDEGAVGLAGTAGRLGLYTQEKQTQACVDAVRPIGKNFRGVQTSSSPFTETHI